MEYLTARLVIGSRNGVIYSEELYLVSLSKRMGGRPVIRRVASVAETSPGVFSSSNSEHLVVSRDVVAGLEKRFDAILARVIKTRRGTVATYFSLTRRVEELTRSRDDKGPYVLVRVDDRLYRIGSWRVDYVGMSSKPLVDRVMKRYTRRRRRA